ncbi:hypothetical protein WN944_003366 [Citrus x changshan-huyou]|uniref:Uncharacterized protein n=1 Tax=Citrus x changshan-huyou TaxID=2935761 RepID=A0AAP0QHI2_9ROSI
MEQKIIRTYTEVLTVILEYRKTNYSSLSPSLSTKSNPIKAIRPPKPSENDDNDGHDAVEVIEPSNGMELNLTSPIPSDELTVSKKLMESFYEAKD